MGKCGGAQNSGGPTACTDARNFIPPHTSAARTRVQTVGIRTRSARGLRPGSAWPCGEQFSGGPRDSQGPPEFLYPIIVLLPRRMCSSRTYSHIRDYAGIHLPMIKASALKSCRKKRSFFYTLMQEKIAAVFLKTLDNNRIEPRTKIRYNGITVQKEIPLKLPVFCYLFHLL